MNDIFMVQSSYKDVSNIYNLEKEIFGEESYSCEEIETLATHPQRFTFLLKQELELIGYISFYITHDHECYVKALCIRPEYRKQGLGKKLLDFAITHAKENKCKSMFLHVKQSNYAAQNLYEKCGLMKVSTIKNYYKNENALVMERLF